MVQIERRRASLIETSVAFIIEAASVLALGVCDVAAVTGVEFRTSLRVRLALDQQTRSRGLVAQQLPRILRFPAVPPRRTGASRPITLGVGHFEERPDDGRHFRRANVLGEGTRYTARKSVVPVAGTTKCCR